MNRFETLEEKVRNLVSPMLVLAEAVEMGITEPADPIKENARVVKENVERLIKLAHDTGL